MITDRWKFTAKRALYRMSSFHFTVRFNLKSFIIIIIIIKMHDLEWHIIMSIIAGALYIVKNFFSWNVHCAPERYLPKFSAIVDGHRGRLAES